MIVEAQNQQSAINLIPNGNGGNGGFGDGAFGGGLFWIIILFFFAIFLGWGNNGNASGGTMNYYGMPAQNYVQQGFDQAAVMAGINGVQTAVANGFANAEVSRCNTQANLTAALNNLGMSMQNCCCENRAATADLKYTIATENCADRAAVSDGVRDIIANQTANTQMILDKMCQQEIDALKSQNQNLQTQLTLANLAASQNAQTAAILTDNLAQTQALEQYLAPVARPAYIVQNPNCCSSFNNGSCCGR